MKLSHRIINHGRQFVFQNRTDCWVITIKPHRFLIAHRFQPFWKWHQWSWRIAIGVYQDASGIKLREGSRCDEGGVGVWVEGLLDVSADPNRHSAWANTPLHLVSGFGF